MRLAFFPSDFIFPSTLFQKCPSFFSRWRMTGTISAKYNSFLVVAFPNVERRYVAIFTTRT